MKLNKQDPDFRTYLALMRICFIGWIIYWGYFLVTGTPWLVVLVSSTTTFAGMAVLLLVATWAQSAMNKFEADMRRAKEAQNTDETQVTENNQN